VIHNFSASNLAIEVEAPWVAFLMFVIPPSINFTIYFSPFDFKPFQHSLQTIIEFTLMVSTLEIQKDLLEPPHNKKNFIQFSFSLSFYATMFLKMFSQVWKAFFQNIFLAYVQEHLYLFIFQSKSEN
jgi:hypothetical protein